MIQHPPLSIFTAFNGRPTQAGLTLLELVTVMAISAVLMLAAKPIITGIGGIATQDRFANAANEFISHLHYARSEAIKTRSAVAVCPQSGSVWQSGWNVYAWTSATVPNPTCPPNPTICPPCPLNPQPCDAASAPAPPCNPRLVNTRTALASHLSLVSSSAVLRYQSAGELESLMPLTFELCQTGVTGETGRRITVQPTGRISVADFQCS